MEHLDRFILDLALIMIATAITTLVFKKIRQPVVLGYIIAGFLISPNFEWLPTVVDTEDITTWADIGIVFLMFGLGLEFSFKKIASVGKSAVITAATVMGGMIIIGYISGQLLGWSNMTSVFLGGMLSMSSTMIILKAYDEMDLKRAKFSKVVLSALIIEDIGGIFMIIILSTISVSQGVSNIPGLLSHLGLMILYLLIWMIFGIYIIPSLLKRTEKLMNDEILLIFSLAVCLGMVVIADAIGFSSALGAFLGGSIIGGTVMGERIEKVVKPIKDLFGVIFFVSVGMMVQPLLLVEYIKPIIILAIVTIVGQMVFATVGILMSGQDLYTSVRGGFSMVQIGEFSFILAALGKDLGVTDDFLYPIVVCISVITIFTTPVFIKNSEHVYNFLDKKLPRSVRLIIKKYTSERRGNKGYEGDWHIYLIKYFKRTFICAAIIFVIYIVGFSLIKPFVMQYMDGLPGELICLVVICALMLPVVTIMCSRRSLMYTKLWTESVGNRLPLVMLNILRIVYCTLFLISVLRRTLNLSHIIIVPIAIIVVAFTVKSDFMKSGALKLELKFITNANEKVFKISREERGLNEDYSWLDQKFYVCRIKVLSKGNNMLILNLVQNIFKTITAIKVERKGRHYTIPKAKFVLKENDILHIMGTEDELDSFIMAVMTRDDLEYLDFDPSTLRDYIYAQVFDEKHVDDQLICCPILIDKESEFYRKTIKTCGFREKYKGNIIGVERDSFPIASPDINLIIEEKDLLWVMGTREMADKLLIAGYMDPEKNKKKGRGILEW